MKEFSVEQKAKAYDKALKVIKDNLNALDEIAETGAKIVNIQTIKNCFYRAFPELKDKVQPQPQLKQEWSEEDEIIYAELIKFFEAMLNCLATEKRHNENRKWLNWLKSIKEKIEKQGKPIDKIEQKPAWSRVKSNFMHLNGN